jgi:hypothetical protein
MKKFHRASTIPLATEGCSPVSMTQAKTVEKYQQHWQILLKGANDSHSEKCITSFVETDVDSGD